jgi:pimeloyl-ACP methyl ester carboxylesterase
LSGGGAGCPATPWFEINWECNATLGEENSRYLTDTDVVAQCRTLGVPTLIIDGACDVRPRWAVDSLHRALPHARRTALAGAGHLPWVEDPDGFHKAVAGFLAQQQPGSAGYAPALAPGQSGQVQPGRGVAGNGRRPSQCR